MDKFVSVKPLDSQVSPELRVLKANDYKRLLTYEQLLKTVELREKKRDQEATAAVANGLRRGYQQGKEQANKQLADELIQFSERMNLAIAKVEQQLVEVVSHAVRKIVQDFDDSVLVKNAVRSGMELVRGSQKLVIRVNPQMYDTVASQIATMQENTRHIEVAGDNHLAKDECILESDIGIVNASIEQQLEAITRSLQKSFPNNKHDQARV